MEFFQPVLIQLLLKKKSILLLTQQLRLKYLDLCQVLQLLSINPDALSLVDSNEHGQDAFDLMGEKQLVCLWFIVLLRHSDVDIIWSILDHLVSAVLEQFVSACIVQIAINLFEKLVFLLELTNHLGLLLEDFILHPSSQFADTLHLQTELLGVLDLLLFVVVECLSRRVMATTPRLNLDRLLVVRF